MFRFEYDGTLMYFVGLYKVVINKYSDGRIFIKIYNDAHKNKDTPTVVVCCSEYRIIDVTDNVEVKEYLNGME